MNEYKYLVVLNVKVKAFDEKDARDLVEDTFGLGEDCGVTIESKRVHESEPIAGKQ
jgi:hypothetical protein